MPEKGQRSRYRPKRKGKGFGGSKRKKNLVEKNPSEEVEIDRAKPSTSQDDLEDVDSSDPDQPLSSSVKKMKLSDEESTGQCEGTGYRLIDLQSLSSVLSSAHKCEEGEKISLILVGFNTKRLNCFSKLKDKRISVYNFSQ